MKVESMIINAISCLNEVCVSINEVKFGTSMKNLINSQIR